MSYRSPSFLMGLANLFAIGGATYHLRTHHIYNLEEHEARMDELEGTLRGHIGLIEESLERIEGKQLTKGQKTSSEDLYTKRGRDEKQDKQKK
ncbi:hypothetical protein E4T42_00796 [Aureobasidium subglaciale]|nr:hypothetical protein E4T38_01888 [Aureobasidium subglaciale]KAI5233015.1 hypothetical protein E4T41_01886 [Aureobasidium subglaciale]KAI5257973.1 hypothetical protein E4T42_00796 [Aureobasidium subglaciale]